MPMTMSPSSHGVRMRMAGLMLAMLLAPEIAYAAALPGPADAGRIEQREEMQAPLATVETPETPTDIFPTVNAPEPSKHITILVHDVHITGMTVFTAAQVKDIYAPYLDHDITLDKVWVMAEQLTQRYHNAGYFLSRAVIPEQDVNDGIIVLRVIEGYIGEVKLDGPLAENRIVRQWIDKLQSYRPVKADQIESVLLHLNDLPGIDLHAVLEPIEQPVESSEGSVRLALEPRPAPRVSGAVSFDNNGSRYLGPYEGQIQAQAVLFPTQRTTFTGLAALPWDEVKYGGLKHEAPLFAGATLELYGSYTNAAPGYTLKPEEIKSVSTSLGTAFDYSIIRQRQENLSSRVALDGQNTKSDILGTPLTRDYIRALRFGLNYQRADAWYGQNTFNTTVSHGLAIFDSSQPGQANLSRAGAVPDFTKAAFDGSRLQGIIENWDVLTAFSAQVASGPLYSSEQFGYGGQAFGRAYDNSEITGDKGVAGSAELRYGGINPYYHFQPLPYGFYDIGAVWNLGQATTPYASGSSAGAGIRLVSDFGLSGNFGLGFPLTRRIGTPIYGNGKNPRYFLQLGYGF